MTVLKFFDLWEASTVTLSESECGRLINALAETIHNADNKGTTVHLFGREQKAYVYLCKAISEMTTNERNV